MVLATHFGVPDSARGILNRSKDEKTMRELWNNDWTGNHAREVLSRRWMCLWCCLCQPAVRAAASAWNNLVAGGAHLRTAPRLSQIHLQPFMLWLQSPARAVYIGPLLKRLRMTGRTQTPAWKAPETTRLMGNW